MIWKRVIINASPLRNLEIYYMKEEVEISHPRFVHIFSSSTPTYHLLGLDQNLVRKLKHPFLKMDLHQVCEEHNQCLYHGVCVSIKFLKLKDIGFQACVCEMISLFETIFTQRKIATTQELECLICLFHIQWPTWNFHWRLSCWKVNHNMNKARDGFSVIIPRNKLVFT